jgi:hypothetical protein
MAGGRDDSNRESLRSQPTSGTDGEDQAANAQIAATELAIYRLLADTATRCHPTS